MVGSWCDEWLTMLCGTDSWISIAGAGCGLIGVGADKEQAWKVYANGPPGVEQTSSSVWGTRWPVESSTGHMVVRTVRQSHVQFLGWTSKPRSSRNNHGDQVMSGDWREATPSPQGLQWFTTKLLGYLTEPQPEDSVQQTDQNGSDRLWKPVWLVWLEGVERLWSGGHASGSQGFHRGWARCGSRASARWWYNEKFPKCLRGCVYYFHVIGVVSSFGCLHIN
jgi:hypothetical protein